MTPEYIETQLMRLPVRELIFGGGSFPPIPPLPPTPGNSFSNTPDDEFNAFITRLGEAFDRTHLSLERQQWTKLIISLREAWGVEE